MKSALIRMGAGTLAAAALSGCATGTVEGSRPATTIPATTTAGTTQPTTTTTAADGTSSAPSFEMPVYGVEPTTTRVLAPGEVTCPPPSGRTVTVHSAVPGSPTLTVGVPEGFSEVTSHGDGVRLTGPAGMTAEITLTPTSRDARDDFERYSDDRVAKYPINSVSVLPGDLCGYSGQKLMGMLAEQPGKATDYADRIVHLWTNSGDFLAVVRLDAPGKTPGFDEARSAMLADFGITMPG